MPLAAIELRSGSGPLIPHERVGIALVLLGFIGSFAFIRMSTRMMRSPRFSWWPGSVVKGGVHVHHLAFGICLMIAAGALGFAFYNDTPWPQIFALFFGIGVGLTIDEFALWIYLDDVYWAEAGRTSIDATVIAAAGMGLIMIGVQPIAFSAASTSAIIESVAAILLVFAAVATCFFKRRLLHGVVGFFLSPIAIYGAIRLGKPDSPWARRFYGERRPEKQARAVQRFAPDRRTERFKQRFRDLVGGLPEDEYEAKLAERADARETAAAMRERADSTGGV
jgi:uncharacterized membrane protein